MDERPGRWLAHPTPEDERGLIGQFGAYGVSRGLLSPTTVDLLERNFDRFAPLFVDSQRPPLRAPGPSLQRWYREHANPAQAEAMKQVLREWLSVPLLEAPIQGMSRTVEPPEAVAASMLSARLAAAEALGDWHDRQALPELLALQARLPERNPILTGAIRRITHPATADALMLEPQGRIAPHRPISELDSMVVTSHDEILHQQIRWRADRAGVKRIWRSLGQGREYDRRHPSGMPELGSFYPQRLSLHFEDGEIATLERGGGEWDYSANDRLYYRLEIQNDALAPTLMHELARVGVAPAGPRFVGESVTLFIDPGEVRVQGYYEFEGTPKNGWVPLLYPIATGDGLGPPRIEAIELRTGQERRALPVTFEQQGYACRIALTPGKVETYQLEVRYRQSIASRSAEYLITTARAWGVPLHKGWFQVIMDSTLGQPRFDLPFREVRERPGFRRFLFEASPFRPDSDLVVHW